MKLYANDLLLLLSLLAADPQMESLKALWGDIVESTLDSIDTIVADENSKLDAIEARIDSITPILLNSSNISGATITISTPGNYLLEEDVTASILINDAGSNSVLDMNNHSIVGALTIVGDRCKVHHGNVFPPAPTGSPSLGIYIHPFATRTVLKALVVVCADSAGVAITGREAIRVDGQYSIIEHCIFVSGSASAGNGSTTTGAIGGIGINIRTSAFYTLVKNCVVLTGNGGSAPGAGGVGGEGGIGIWCQASDDTEIIGCIILSTGNGGDGDSGSGTGGAGGPGMRLGTSSVDVSVRDSVIRNTGQGGAGATPGAGGQGIHNQVTAAATRSIVLRNKAHNIAGVNFNLNNVGTEQGVQISPYPPTTTAINAYANTYVS